MNSPSLKQICILLHVEPLISCMLPRDPERFLRLILPHQPRYIILIQVFNQPWPHTLPFNRSDESASHVLVWIFHAGVIVFEAFASRRHCMVSLWMVTIQDVWKGGSNLSRGGSCSTFHLIFHKFPHETEIIWSQRGVQENHL